MKSAPVRCQCSTCRAVLYQASEAVHPVLFVRREDPRRHCQVPKLVHGYHEVLLKMIHILRKLHETMVRVSVQAIGLATL